MTTEVPEAAPVWELERIHSGEGAGPGHEVGFLPYPIMEFRHLLDAAISHHPPPSFIDLGAGIGTKVELARLAGIHAASGIEISDHLLECAESYGFAVFRGDVRTYRVAGIGIVYLNHPLADTQQEAELELRIQAELSPGSVLISVHSHLPPPTGSHWLHLAQVEPHDVAVAKRAC
jgi:trans-aconitate methyltransferase